MEQLFSAGKTYLKINSLVKTPLHEVLAIERSGLWAPAHNISTRTCNTGETSSNCSVKLSLSPHILAWGGASQPLTP